jgi:polyisoprenoid-binding protein YceI
MRKLSVVLLSVAALAADYSIDPAHSSASFGVTHMMVSTVRGQFSKVSGTVRYDPNDLAGSRVEASIDAATIDTQQAKRDAHLRSADFFDTEKYPNITFRSTRWTRENGKLKIAGDLTIHGITKPVVLDVTGPGAEVKGADGSMLIGATASTTVSRRAFGLTWNKLMETGGAVVGDEISITLDIEAKRK